MSTTENVPMRVVLENKKLSSDKVVELVRSKEKKKNFKKFFELFFGDGCC